MPMQWTTNRQFAAPAAAGAVTVTPNAVNWVNSAWVEVLASAPAALMLTGVSNPVAGVVTPFEVDVGIGAIAAETVITTFRGDYSDATFRGMGYLPHVLPLDAIPATSRVSVRLRKSGTSVVPWTFALTYLEKPLVGNLQTTTQPQRVLPAAAILTVATAATAWGNGAWVVLTATAAADLVVTQVVLKTFNGALQWELDLGMGSAGAETVITTVHGLRGGLADGPNGLPLWNPLAVIPSGSRVVARARGAEAVARTTTVAVMYHHAPV